MKIDYIETWFILSDERILTTNGYKSAESRLLMSDDSRVKKATKYLYINSDMVHVQDDSTLVYRHYYKKV